MNATEKIIAAIQKLEELRDGATSGVWEYNSEPWGDISSEQEPGSGVATGVAEEMDEFDGTLVIVLHRTIDAQLAILREALALPLSSEDDFLAYEFGPHMQLALAVLGES